jgi:hypothetical protein
MSRFAPTGRARQRSPAHARAIGIAVALPRGLILPRGTRLRGAAVKAENRANRQTIAYLEQVIDDQAAEIERLVTKLASYENGERQRRRVTPRIY